MPYYGCLIMILRIRIQTSAPWRAAEAQTDLNVIRIPNVQPPSSVMTPLNGPVSVSKQRQNLENKLATE